MEPKPMSMGLQKAVNWLFIEQQLFYNNCLLYLHPVPVPGVYNESMNHYTQINLQQHNLKTVSSPQWD